MSADDPGRIGEEVIHMTERYIDPNSGAAPQPGGLVAGGVRRAQVEEAPEAREVPETPEQPEVPEAEAPEAPEQPEVPEQPEETLEEQGEVEGESEAGEEKDYSELLSGSVVDVEKYLAENPEEMEAVKAAEQQREKPRKGILEL